MNTIKRIDENTIIVESVHYTTNILKKIEVIAKSGFVIDSVKINGIYYYPFKEDKNNTK